MRSIPVPPCAGGEGASCASDSTVAMARSWSEVFSDLVPFGGETEESLGL